MNQKVHDIHILVYNTHLFIGLKKHIVQPDPIPPNPVTPSRRRRPYESLVPNSREKKTRKEEAIPSVKEICKKNNTDPLFIFTKEELEELKKNWMQEKENTTTKHMI